MGYAIAQVLAQQGAEVILVSGPVQKKLKHPQVRIIPVTSASEMYTLCIEWFPKVDMAIMSAAVADFTPKHYNDSKVKTGEKTKDLNLILKPTKDIALELGKMKRPDQILIGFALETNNEEANAIQKIKSKNLDFIVLNSLNDKGAGFGFDTNKVTIIHKDNKRKSFELKSKDEVANDIVKELIDLLKS